LLLVSTIAQQIAALNRLEGAIDAANASAGTGKKDKKRMTFAKRTGKSKRNLIISIHPPADASMMP
jgi:hypothetical protein